MLSNNSYKEFMKNQKAKDGEMITHTTEFGIRYKK